MILSQRIQSLTASPIRRLSPYADAAKAAGKKVYHLNIGQPDIATPAQFMDSVREFQAPVIAYSNSKGEMFLLKAIQKYYAEKGMDYAIEDIFVTNGGSEALIFAVMALCDPGDEIMVFEPFYANYTSYQRRKRLPPAQRRRNRKAHYSENQSNSAHQPRQSYRRSLYRRRTGYDFPHRAQA